MMLHPPWHAIKIPLLLLLAALLLAGAGILWSSNTQLEANKNLQQQTRTRQAAQQKLQRSNVEKALIQQNLGGYQNLVARGFIGEENRLAWLEAVQQANRDAALYGLNYTLAPRTAAAATLAKGLPLGQTVMTLRMPMLVETDLPRFLEALQQRTRSVFRVRACQITRTSEAAPEALNRPELETECELLWFTLATATRTVQ
ncbi:MAG: hypothetical protein ABL892_07005 [Thiobacillaceae bacterium]